ncbi:multicopper oxidase domain-containing protein [Sulfurimonas sp. SAG-AH-194-C21]|nr:multicopper oxidase domain-containing protein [Sulfurimonas sp. SAG-AH-194-C21]MDF1884265.1 multicopper oxidase domain-containing protein [Sulfurimonas sp. SAG-AH-194-C21]
MERRNFLQFSMAGLAKVAAGTTALTVAVSSAHAATINRTLYITEGYITQITGEDIYFMGFSNSTSELNIPGDPFIIHEGDTVSVTIVNTLQTPHSFVIDGQIDSGVIEAGTTKTVTFTATRAGTFFYYDKLNAPYNRLCGLHGPVAIMPRDSTNELYPGSPTFVKQQFWLFNDIDPIWNAMVENGNTPNTPFIPRFFTLNGLGGRPPGAPGYSDPTLNNMYDPRSYLKGSIGDRTLVRVLNAGMAQQAVHTHANHMEWLTSNGQIRPDIWLKDIVPLDGNGGIVDVIFPFDPPPDAWPPVTTGTYPMHLHTEMSQTAGGGFYLFGAITDIFYV